jgi:hypothetical protein
MSTPISTPKVRVTSQGDVGIGTSVPLQKLHVAGNLAIDAGKTYKISNVDVLSATALGNSVISSSLQEVGNLATLNVTGWRMRFILLWVAGSSSLHMEGGPKRLMHHDGEGSPTISPPRQIRPSPASVAGVYCQRRQSLSARELVGSSPLHFAIESRHARRRPRVTCRGRHRATRPGPRRPGMEGHGHVQSDRPPPPDDREIFVQVYWSGRRLSVAYLGGPLFRRNLRFSRHLRVYGHAYLDGRDEGWSCKPLYELRVQFAGWADRKSGFCTVT